eukprot:950149-Prymnesium_polylepis.1
MKRLRKQRPFLEGVRTSSNELRGACLVVWLVVAAQAGSSYYADAIKNKKNPTPSSRSSPRTSAVSRRRATPAVTALLRRLAKRWCADTTSYGETSTHDFYSHHAVAISLAIVTGEAEAIVNGVSWRETALAGGEHRG